MKELIEKIVRGRHSMTAEQFEKAIKRQLKKYAAETPNDQDLGNKFRKEINE